MGCPWKSFQQAGQGFCERNLCAWVREPANTWSNLGYVLAGLFIWKAASAHNRPVLRWLGIVAILTGLGSGFFHASGVYWAGAADYSSMFLGTGIMTALNVERWLGGQASVSVRYSRWNAILVARSVRQAL